MLTSKSFRKLLDDNLARLAVAGASLGPPDDISVGRMFSTWLIHRCMPRDTISRIMEEHLNRPYCCTVDDLLDFVVEHLLEFYYHGDKIEVFFPSDENFRRYAEDFRSKTLFVRSTAPTALGEGKLDLEGHSAVEIWDNGTGFTVELLKAAMSAYNPLSSDVLQGPDFTLNAGKQSEIADAHYPAKGAEHVLMRITCSCTPRALEETAWETRALLRSAWRSLKSLGYVQEQRIGLNIQRHGGESPVFFWLSEEHLDMLKRAGAFPSDPEATEEPQRKRPVSLILNYLWRCLNYYYLRPGKKDTMERRIRNALCLLMESDRQKNQAVHLALCFAAIEALICDKKDGIADRLSQNVATLLQPDSNERIAAIKKVKKLYDLRSRVLHGAKTEIDAGFEQQARTLAAGVFMAVLEWRMFVKRMGEQNKHVAEFFDALEEARVSGSRFVGVPEETSSWLPQVGQR